MKILIIDYVSPLLLELLEESKINYLYLPTHSEQFILDKINKFNGLIVRNRFQINNFFLKKCKNLQFIARYGSGMESIDVKYANQLGIKCFNSAEGNCNAVSEHALGMLLSLLHKIHKSMEELKTGVWKRNENLGNELSGKNIGVIGYGNTGKAFCEKLKGFNCNIYCYDKYKKNYGTSSIQECSMESLYNHADVISLHIPINDETKYLINDYFIQKMRRPFYIINTSRGKIINTSDLINGLKNKKIIGACLDVIEYECAGFINTNFNDDYNYLLNCKNIIMTPHIAGLSYESHLKISQTLFDKIIQLI